jgi:hypothetical protein
MVTSNNVGASSYPPSLRNTSLLTEICSAIAVVVFIPPVTYVWTARIVVVAELFVASVVQPASVPGISRAISGYGTTMHLSLVFDTIIIAIIVAVAPR